jgi:threonine/homoserine/homoserine lactone efflux protein
MPSTRRRYLTALGTALTNPKALAFFAALFPLFLNRNAPLAPQFAILTGTFMALSFLSLMICGVGAGRFRRWLARPAVSQWLNRGSGAAMMLFGTVMIVRR